jgi:16S rRNA G966 N2-methylase RsmD
MDPPYQKNLVNSTLEMVIAAKILTPGGTIVVEHAPKEALDEKWASLVSFEKRTNTTHISILQLEEE